MSEAINVRTDSTGDDSPHEAIAVSGGPVAPDRLDDAQRAVWLAAVGRLGVEWSETVAADLEAFAIETARRDAAEAVLRAHGAVLILRDERGAVTGSKEAPELRIARSARAAADDLAERLRLGPGGSGSICRCGSLAYSEKDPTRCHRGHVLRENTAATIVGARSAQFWSAHTVEYERRVDDLIARKGYARAVASPALVSIASGLAQISILSASAWARVVQEAGPLTLAGRKRGPYLVWLESRDRELQYTRAYESFPPAPAKRLPVDSGLPEREADGAA